jgi:hypothetical protein
MKNIIIFFSICMFIVGCKTTDDCIENKILGNMGNVINSDDDEHSPTLLLCPTTLKSKYPNIDTNNYLYYTTTSPKGEHDEEIYYLYLDEIENGSFLTAEDFPLNNSSLFRNAGVPVFRYDIDEGKLEVYFAALPKMGRLSRDIYYAEMDINTNEWSIPIQLPINSKSWESHPTISIDGKILLFASDREGGLGDIDIWASYKDDDGNWSEPINLGSEINTANIDYTPMFTDNNNITFSTNGRGRVARKDFDIYYATYDTTNKMWSNSKMYGFPINTEFNETGATIWNNRIFLSSDRRGGCGGRDIYSYQMCGPVSISGSVKCDVINEILSGEMYLYDTEENLINQSIVKEDGSFDLGDIEPNKNYILDYKNKCYPLKQNKYNFRTPCSDSTAIKIVVTMVMPEKTKQIELTDVSIHHFVTGYYKPNTESNLNSLKLGFSYNLFGKNAKSKYIENPKDDYNQYVDTVEGSLNDAVNYIAHLIEILDNKCNSDKNKSKLIIDVEGWADPRNINPDAEYIEDDIDDKPFGVFVKKGTKMDNELLSILRAYFTAKYFESEIKKRYNNLEEIVDKIEWKIAGMGVDKNENTDEGSKRRVTINLQFVE